MKPKTKRILKRTAYVLLGLFLLLIIGTGVAYKYAMYNIFRDTPNRLAFEGDLHPVPFEWSSDTYEDYTEPHSAILIPVSIPNIPEKLYMQFDTGAANSFIELGALESLKLRGVKFEIIEEDDTTYIKELELNVAGNRVILRKGHLGGQQYRLDWDDPDAKNIIGSFGADLLDQKICEIDFPAQEIRFHLQRSEEQKSLGAFTPFKFKGRRIMLPAKIDGTDVEVFYDSGCSAFGLLTSKYHYDRLTNSNDKEIAYGANRHGESVPIHHKPSDVRIVLGTADLSLERVSYAEMYNFLQTTVGRFVGGGFLGNKCLTESTLILDTKASEFLVTKSTKSADISPNAANSHSSDEVSHEQ